MKTNIRYVLMSALQDRLFLGLLLLIVIGVFVSYALGAAAFIEKQQTSIVFAASSSRLILVIGMIVFVCFHIRSSFDNREMDVMLSRPISRDQIVLSHWLGFSLVSSLLVIPLVLLLLLLGASSGSGLMIWAVSLICELWFVVAFAQFAAFILSSAVLAVLATLAFYTLSRMMILFMMTASQSMGASDLGVLKYAIDWIGMVIPRIDLFTKSEWLLYGLGEQPTWELFVPQAILYIALLLVACVLDFRKKQF